jgi:hypothetical protein
MATGEWHHDFHLKTRQLRDCESQPSKKWGAAAQLSSGSPPLSVNHNGYFCDLRLRQNTCKLALLLLPARSVAVTVM